MILMEIFNNKSIRQFIQEQFTQLEALVSPNQGNIGKYLDYIVFKAEKALKPLLNMESLYDENASVNILDNIFNSYGISLYTNSVLHGLLMDSSFRDFDSLGELLDTNEQLIGYQGFNITNQDGNYQTIKNTARSKGKQRLQYMAVLDGTANQIVDNIVRDIKKNLLRLIY